MELFISSSEFHSGLFKLNSFGIKLLQLTATSPSTSSGLAESKKALKVGLRYNLPPRLDTKRFAEIE